MTNQNSSYHTSDLALATVLALFYALEAVDRSNPYKAEFFFKRDDQLDNVIESFWRRELKIEPIAFFNQLKVLKSQLHQGGNYEK